MAQPKDKPTQTTDVKPNVLLNASRPPIIHPGSFKYRASPRSLYGARPPKKGKSDAVS